MPLASISQPEFLFVSPTLRLRRYEGDHAFALSWYQDPDLVYLVDGVREPYTPEKLARMYAYLNDHGEVYWIEQLRSDAFIPIDDVTFWPEDLPIVIGDPVCRGQGIGKQVLSALIRRGGELVFSALHVAEIYRWNPGSARMFQSVGFLPSGATLHGTSYCLSLQDG